MTTSFFLSVSSFTLLKIVFFLEFYYIENQIILLQYSLEHLADLDAVYDLTLAFKIPWLPLKSKQLGPSLLGKIQHCYFYVYFLLYLSWIKIYPDVIFTVLLFKYFISLVNFEISTKLHFFATPF